MENLNPNEVFDMLKNGSDTRRIKSLSILHTTLQEYVETGGDNFSIRVIAKLSEENGGPKEQSIRNKTGEPFKMLISSWENYARKKVDRKPKPSELRVKANGSPSAKDILKFIEDPALRSMIGIVFSERDLYLRENKLLKNATEIVLDKRAIINSNENHVANKLTNYELDAIKSAISDDFFKRQGWTSDDDGRVFSGRTRIYGAGYTTALRKILSSQGGN